MKRTLLIIGIAFLSMSFFGQGEVVKKYFDKFEDNEAYTKVSVSQKMFSLFTDLEAGSKAEKEFLEAVSKLKGMKVIMSDSVVDASAIYKQAVADVEKAGYEELMSVKDAEENLTFSILESGDVIEEMIMVAGGHKRFVMLSIYGEIDLNTLSKIAQEMRIEGMEQLGKMNHDHDKKNGTY